MILSRKGVLAQECDPSRRCQGGHHQSICTARDPPKIPPDASPVKQAPKKSEPTKQSDQKINVEHEVTMVNRNSPKNNQSRRILLQTATTEAFSQDGRDSIPVRVLLDSGSQRSYITSHLKERS